MDQLEIKYMRVADLKPYEGNAKIHTDEQIEQIMESIRQFGMNDPIAIWKNGEIIEGHGRLIACQRLNIETVPVIALDDLTDEQRRAYMNVHNQLTMNTGFDIDLLNAELWKIENIDMAKFGFDLSGFDEEDEEVEEDGYQEPNEIPKRAEKGNIFLLGKHRLMCGDSTNSEDVAKLIGGGYCNLCVTDPPYNVGVKNSQGMTIENDNMPTESFIKFLTSAFQNMQTALSPGGAFYVWYAARSEGAFTAAMAAAGLQIREQLIWVKNAFTLGRQDYQWRHEPCLYGWKDGASHYFTNSRSESTVIDDTPDLDHMSKAEALELLKRIYENSATTAVYEKKPALDSLHPTMKPVALIGYQIANSSRKGDNVLDLFGGSGTTLIACEQLGRQCFMMEYDPHYADVIIDRWEKFTGNSAELING